MAVLLGSTSTGANSANSNSAGIAFATRLQCLQSGTIETVWLRFGASPPAAADTHWAVYSDGTTVPNARLIPDQTGQAGTANTYTSFPISPTLHVDAGTFYWIAFLGNNTTLNYTDFATTGGNSSDDTTASMADPWQSQATFNNIVNMRAEGTPDSVINLNQSIPFITRGGI